MATKTLRPDGVGDYTNIEDEYPGGTAHWDCVNDETPDDSSSYIRQVNTTQRKDAYTLQPASIPAGSTINSVTVHWRWNSGSGSWAAKIQPFLRLGTDETAGTEIQTTQGDFKNDSEVLSRPGGGSWAASDLNSLQVAIGMRSSYATTSCSCTQIYVVIDYIPSGGVADGDLIGIGVIKKS